MEPITDPIAQAIIIGWSSIIIIIVVTYIINFFSTYGKSMVIVAMWVAGIAAVIGIIAVAWPVIIIVFVIWMAMRYVDNAAQKAAFDAMAQAESNQMMADFVKQMKNNNK